MLLYAKTENNGKPGRQKLHGFGPVLFDQERSKEDNSYFVWILGTYLE